MPPVMAAANLQAGSLVHGFFLRTGGVSEGIYASLNCGRGSNDERDRVEENRSRAASRLGITSALLAGPRQIHSPTAVIAAGPWDMGEAPEADAVVTKTRGLAVCVLTADCAPILMADVEAGVIAAVHAGWKGAKAGVIESAIGAMESLGARASRIAAAIGPCISQAAYEVSSEFKAGFVTGAPGNEKYFEQHESGRPHFGLPAYVKDRLTRCRMANVQDVGVCTYENESILFSYRRSVHRAERDYGRQISAILLR
ncbi:MAG: peptidoglycan editing factor PgeF [Rhodomicrobium sp.]|nr:peptidoglycan editing factor PgeF [Rhodomicrobium sp.]